MINFESVEIEIVGVEPTAGGIKPSPPPYKYKLDKHLFMYFLKYFISRQPYGYIFVTAGPTAGPTRVVIICSYIITDIIT